MPLSVLNWQVEFEFKVDGKAHNIYGDGFAVWLTKERAKQGPVFGSLGECVTLALHTNSRVEVLVAVISVYPLASFGGA